MSVSENKERFLNLLSSVQRNGIDKLIKWIDTTDFFTAPASTRFHGAYEGGLLEHSLNVYDAFMMLYGSDSAMQGCTDSIILVTLLHDLCKSGFYSVEMRNKKNEQGEWVKVPVYIIEDQFPMGHGEKSVWLVERFVRLNPSEALAIRWHMGGFDDAVKGGCYALSGAYEYSALALRLHIADMHASYIVEGKKHTS